MILIILLLILHKVNVFNNNEGCTILNMKKNMLLYIQRYSLERKVSVFFENLPHVAILRISHANKDRLYNVNITDNIRGLTMLCFAVPLDKTSGESLYCIANTH